MRCARESILLVNGKTKLAPPACDHLHCPQCDTDVRNAIGVSPEFDHWNGTAAECAALYAVDDWRTSPSIRNGVGDTYRLYVCRCQYWLESDQSYLVDDHKEYNKPTMPWVCGGHSEKN